MLKEGRAPLIQYWPVMETDLVVQGGVGEQVFLQHVLPMIVNNNIELLQEEGRVARIGYGQGVDHMQKYYLEEDGEGKMVFNMNRPDGPGVIRGFVEEALKSEKGILYDLLWNGKLKIPVFYSGRYGDADALIESPDSVKEWMMSLRDKNGDPILEIEYKFQDSKVSSTRIRKNQHAFLNPFNVYEWARGLRFPRWGYEVSEKEGGTQEALAAQLIQEFEKVFEKGINEGEIRANIAELLEGATGIALNTFDIYLNGILMNHVLYVRSKHPEEFIFELHHLKDVAPTRLSEYKAFLQQKGISDAREAEIKQFLTLVQTELIRSRGEALVEQSTSVVPEEIVDVLGQERVKAVTDKVNQFFAVSSPVERPAASASPIPSDDEAAERGRLVDEAMDANTFDQRIRKGEISLDQLPQYIRALDNEASEWEALDSLDSHSRYDPERGEYVSIRMEIPPFGGRAKVLQGILDAMLADDSTASASPIGGIDLNPELLDLQIRRDGNGIPLPVGQQPIYNMKIDGFFPVIINIMPVVTSPLLLGLLDTEAPYDSADADDDSDATLFELGLVDKYRNKYIRKV